MAKKKETVKKDILEDLIARIKTNIEELTEEFDKSLTNASAARRARKLTSELSKQFKEFRAESVAHFKK